MGRIDLGAVFAVITTTVISKFFHELGMIDWIVISLLIISFGTSGIVSIETETRSGRKRLGKYFAGHGGMLDRFDTVLFAVPVIFVWIYLEIFKR